MNQPTHGWTRHGHAVHQNTMDHLPTETRYQRFNKKAALKVTSYVGSMTCAYIFCVLALLSLPAVLSGFPAFHDVFPNWAITPSLIALIAWIAQTFIQLVLLSVIMVGQDVQSQASDARAAKTFEDTEKILDSMDIRTEGGIKDLADLIRSLEDKLEKK